MPWGALTKFGSFLPNTLIISLAVQTSYAWKLLSFFLCPPRKHSYWRVAIVIGIGWKIFALSALESLGHLRLESWIRQYIYVEVLLFFNDDYWALFGFICILTSFAFFFIFQQIGIDFTVTSLWALWFDWAEWLFFVSESSKLSLKLLIVVVIFFGRFINFEFVLAFVFVLLRCFLRLDFHGLTTLPSFWRYFLFLLGKYIIHFFFISHFGEDIGLGVLNLW